MSRAYEICVKESVKENIRARDGISSNLEILDVLPREQTSEILAKELEEKGFEREGDVLRRNDDGIETTVNVQTGEILVRLEKEKVFEKEIVQRRTIDSDHEKSERIRLENDVKKKLESETKEEQNKLTEEVANQLEKHLIGLRKELDQIVNRVTAESLKAKARSLGEIKEMSEDAETGNLTIKIKV